MQATLLSLKPLKFEEDEGALSDHEDESKDFMSMLPCAIKRTISKTKDDSEVISSPMVRVTSPTKARRSRKVFANICSFQSDERIENDNKPCTYQVIVEKASDATTVCSHQIPDDESANSNVLSHFNHSEFAKPSSDDEYIDVNSVPCQSSDSEERLCSQAEVDAFMAPLPPMQDAPAFVPSYNEFVPTFLS